MNKAELVARLAEAASMNKVLAESAVNNLTDIISAELIGGGDVTLVGFGTFKVVDTAARTGRNPATGEALQIPAGKKVKFSPGKAFKDAFKAD